MSASLQLYKEFVDELVKIREGALAKWVVGNGFPDLPENKPINQLLRKLTPKERAEVAKIIQRARDGGIHDTLAFLQEEMSLGGLRIFKSGTRLPFEPFGTELHYDWVARRSGDKWPKQPLQKGRVKRPARATPKATT